MEAWHGGSSIGQPLGQGTCGALNRPWSLQGNKLGGGCVVHTAPAQGCDIVRAGLGGCRAWSNPGRALTLHEISTGLLRAATPAET